MPRDVPVCPVPQDEWLEVLASTPWRIWHSNRLQHCMWDDRPWQQ